MTREELKQQIQSKESYLCVGLDTDANRIPAHLRSHADAVFEFNKQIIDATKDLCVAYKLNTAFYEAMGSKGWDVMERTVNYIPSEHFKIADAKRADIGNTSAQYAQAFFETLKFDAVTVAPYMGSDSVAPFIDTAGKWTILLALTSNPGSKDFEELHLNTLENNAEDNKVYEAVIRKSSMWGSNENMMYVVGATKAEQIISIRKLVPDHFLLIPGVGFQGGSLEEVSKAGINKDVGLLINVSRAIIYASEGEDFTAEARAIALQYQKEMSEFIKR